MFTVYFDESGSPDDTKALVVGGFLAEAQQWIEFGRNWSEALKHFGVSSLHMKHFAHSRGEFKDWKGDENRRRRFLSRLINIIKTRVRHSFVDAVLMDDYRQVDAKYYLSDCFKPYTIAARTCVTKVHNWAKKNAINLEMIEYSFEDGAQDRGDLIHRLTRDGIGNFGFIPKAQSVALQAADLLAYEHLLANTRIQIGAIQYWDELRHPLRALNEIPNDKGLDWGVYNAKNLEDFCINVKIPQRSMADASERGSI